MKHQKIVWNFNTRQWFCTTCGRVSDHAIEQDALVELDELECQLPYVEYSGNAPGEETAQLIKKALQDGTEKPSRIAHPQAAPSGAPPPTTILPVGRRQIG